MTNTTVYFVVGSLVRTPMGIGTIASIWNSGDLTRATVNVNGVRFVFNFSDLREVWND